MQLAEFTGGLAKVGPEEQRQLDALCQSPIACFLLQLQPEASDFALRAGIVAFASAYESGDTEYWLASGMTEAFRARIKRNLENRANTEPGAKATWKARVAATWPAVFRPRRGLVPGAAELFQQHLAGCEDACKEARLGRLPRRLLDEDEEEDDELAEEEEEVDDHLAELEEEEDDDDLGLQQMEVDEEEEKDEDVVRSLCWGRKKTAPSTMVSPQMTMTSCWPKCKRNIKQLGRIWSNVSKNSGKSRIWMTC